MGYLVAESISMHFIAINSLCSNQSFNIPQLDELMNKLFYYKK